MTAVYVVPRGGMWSPLLNPTRTARRHFGGLVAEVDGLHSVLSALAERGKGEQACIQLVVSPARAVRGGGRDRSWWARIALGILKAPFVIFLAVTAGQISRRSTASPTPPRVSAVRAATCLAFLDAGSDSPMEVAMPQLDRFPHEEALPVSQFRSSRLRLAPAEHPARRTPKSLGIANDGPPDQIGLRVADARHHIHVQGVTGVGKSTWLANHVLGEADTGRGVVLLDCQGDLARHVLDRLPLSAGDRLVILDPAETEAPPAWNVLAPLDYPTGTGRDRETAQRDDETARRDDDTGREWAAENLVGVFRRLYAAWWGPRMDDVLRAACLTLVRRPGATLAEVIPVLTRPEFRRAILTKHGEPEGFDGFWDSYDALTPGQRNQLAGPVLSRLRSVLSRRFARDLLGTARSTINLADILDGGILIARLLKGEIGEHTTQLVGSLLLSGLWSAATRRTTLAPEDRRDATVVVDECHNFLHLPIGVDDALAEARGYRLSLVLAHQHLTQLPPEVRDAVDANARNKLLFTVSPNDAAKLVRHVAPYFDERDLARRPAFEVLARTVHHGHDTPPFTLNTQPLPPPIPGRAEQLRAAARQRTGLTAEQRARAARRRHVGTSPRAARLSSAGSNHAMRAGQSSGHPLGQSPVTEQATCDWPID